MVRIKSGRTSTGLEYHKENASQDGHFAGGQHRNTDCRIDVATTQMEDRHGQGSDAEAKAQRDHLNRRRRGRIPRYCRPRGQEDKETSCPTLGQARRPEVPSCELAESAVDERHVDCPARFTATTPRRCLEQLFWFHTG